MTEWGQMDAATFRASGALYAVNKHVLWPIGLAVAVDEENNHFRVMVLDAPETIIEGTINLKAEPGGCHPSERFNRFAKARVDEMPEMEAAMATKALQRIIPGFGIDPTRSSD